ncbi:potassium channel family protein [Rubrobacter aplysinae]|uniref:potassium channel family protein n=1 Tax=Rubrobacter aplysinae TaxID=909625 RepID=UPI00064B942E|nr:TrkA C-terminal domain-containing protein [Rubrobacter aplysinae]
MREDKSQKSQKPRNLKEMLAEAKNTSELMVDLAYAAIFYNSEDFSEEVFRLEERLNDLVFDMRSLAVLAARSPADAGQMAGILQVVTDIEKIGNAAYDIAKIVVKKLGIPSELLQDLPEAEEVTSRVRVYPESQMDGRSLGDLDLPVESGMRPIAIRSDVEWNFDPEPDDVLREGDVIFLQGASEGIEGVRDLAGAPPLERLVSEDEGVGATESLSELERAVDLLIEMKNLSEVAVGLAYSALLYYDAGLAREVVAIEDEMDGMRYRTERWVLLAARHMESPSRLRGILHLATASETIADCAQEMVWIVEKGEEVHPVLSAAVGESDEVVLKLTVVAESPADGRTLGELKLETETGMYALAVNRGGRWTYRPRDSYRLREGDSLLASGAPEGLEPFAELFGALEEIEELGE